MATNSSGGGVGSQVIPAGSPEVGVGVAVGVAVGTGVGLAVGTDAEPPQYPRAATIASPSRSRTVSWADRLARPQPASRQVRCYPRMLSSSKATRPRAEIESPSTSGRARRYACSWKSGARSASREIVSSISR